MKELLVASKKASDPWSQKTLDQLFSQVSLGQVDLSDYLSPIEYRKVIHPLSKQWMTPTAKANCRPKICSVLVEGPSMADQE